MLPSEQLFPNLLKKLEVELRKIDTIDTSLAY